MTCLTLTLGVVYLLFSVGSADVTGPLTQHFQDWLNSNGYKSYDYVRADFGTKGSYGGRRSADDKITNQPVVFIHGNSDTALNTGVSSPGWDASISYFLGKGYTSAELYATSWGDNSALSAGQRTHDCDTVIRIRKFLEAVIVYTNATKIDIIGHSMGVTLGRKAVKGGTLKTSSKTCNLGSALTNKVDTFVGISGANYGLCSCEGGTEYIEPTCSGVTGFWPGDSCGFNVLDCGGVMIPCGEPTYSGFLTDLNSDPNKEGTYVYSMYSLMDEIIMYGCQVWGRPTPLIPGSTGQKTYSTYGHYETKSLTAEDQYNFVVNHAQ